MLDKSNRTDTHSFPTQDGIFMSLQVGAGSEGFYVTHEGLWMGSNSPEDAPFKVDMGGNMSLQGYLRTGDASNDINAGVVKVHGGKIEAKTISTEHLAALSVTADEIAAGTITANKIQAGIFVATGGAAGDVNAGTTTINGGKITTNSIKAAQIEAKTITADEIKDATITGGKIANTTITDGKIVNNTITGGKIADTTITGAKIANATITDGKIANTTITGGKIANTTITGGKIAGTTITGAKIAGGAITADKIASNTITAAEIKANTITSDEITTNLLETKHQYVTTGLKIAGGAQSVSGLDVTGTKNWVMPHPLLEDKQLRHSCLEGPEVADFYRGVVKLKDGKATIELKPYFDAIHVEEGRQVFLTCPIPMVHTTSFKKNIIEIEVPQDIWDTYKGYGQHDVQWLVIATRDIEFEEVSDDSLWDENLKKNVKISDIRAAGEGWNERKKKVTSFEEIREDLGLPIFNK